MSRVTLAIIVAESGERYKLIGWRAGSHETGTPSCPAKLYHRTLESGWKFLESWNGAISDEKSTLTVPKSDEEVLKEALSRLNDHYGETTAKIHLQPSSESNHLDQPLGWGHKADADPDVDAVIAVTSS
jgi:hypothetical protein